MGTQQEFWEKLKAKYEEKNRNLQQREHELRLKLEAMDAIIGDCSGRKANEVLPPNTMSVPDVVPTTSHIPTTPIRGNNPVTGSIPAASDRPKTTIPVPTVTQNTGKITACSKPRSPINMSKPAHKSPPVVSTTENEEIICQHLPANIDNSEQSPQLPPPQQEKSGIFHCLFSMFSSSKGKPQVSSEPQAVPQGFEVVPLDPQSIQQQNIAMSENTSGNGDSCNCNTCTKCTINGKEQCPCNSRNPQYSDQSSTTPQNTQQQDDVAVSTQFIPRPDLCQRMKRSGNRNQNCMCNPCEAKVGNEQVSNTLQTAQQKSDTVSKDNGSRDKCNCDICASVKGECPSNLINTGCDEQPSKIPQNMQQQTPKPEFCQRDDNYVYKSENCSCEPCDVEIDDKQPFNAAQDIQQKSSKCDSNGNGDYCNCNVCDRYSLPGRNGTTQCPCNFYMNATNMCTESSNQPTKDIEPVTNALLSLGSPSKMSLKSADLYYMKNIHDLARAQKDLLKQVNDLEQKEKIYSNVFGQYKNVNFSSGNKSVCCPCTNVTASLNSGPKTNAELKLENFLLKNELKDMRLEVKQHLERMEGPMRFKIESERFKCAQLEQKLEETEKQLAKMQELCEKEMNSLKMQLCNANTNLYNLNTLNDQTMQELQEYQKKCVKLEEDIIRQKISEAETIKSLQASLCSQANANVVKDECDLHQIARELSNVLRECEPCGECMNLPEDLTSAARLLKSLTDMVDLKLNKAEEDQGKGKSTAVAERDVTRDVTSKGSNRGAEILEISAVQEITGISKAEEKTSRTSSVKRASLTITAQAPPQIEEKTSKTSSAKQESLKDVTNASQLEEKVSKISKTSSGKGEPPNTIDDIPQMEEKSSKTSKSSAKEDSLKGAVEVPEIETKTSRSSRASKTSSVKIETPTIDQPGQAEEVIDSSSQKRSSASETEVKSGRGSVVFHDTPTVKTTDSTTKPKISCKCVKPRKSKEIDQLWPKTDAPVTLKDSDQLDVPVASSMKKKCECSVSKKLKEIEAEQRTYEKQLTGTTSSKKICKCGVKDEVKLEIEPIDTELKPSGDDIDQLQLKASERFKLSHQVTASRSKDLLKSATSIKCLKVKENFPFDIDTQVDVINKPPDGVHVTTTITDSGTLEVITEGPEGIIETTLIYTNSGNVEVVTEILEYQGRGKGRGAKGGKLEDLALESPDSAIPAIEGPISDAPKTEDEDLAAPEVVEPTTVTAENVEGNPAVMDTSDVKDTVEPQKPDTKVDSGGPAGSNPNCRCRDCPVIQLKKEAEEGRADNQGDQIVSVQPDQTVEPQADQLGQSAEPEAPTTSEVVQDVDKVSNADPGVGNVTVEEATNVVVSAQVQETADVVEATVSKQISDTDKGIDKTLSLSMHVENPEDIRKIAQISDNSKEPPPS